MVPTTTDDPGTKNWGLQTISNMIYNYFFNELSQNFFGELNKHVLMAHYDDKIENCDLKLNMSGLI